MTSQRLSGRTLRFSLDGTAFPVPTAVVVGLEGLDGVFARGGGAPPVADVGPEELVGVVSLGPTLLQAPLVTRVERRDGAVWVRFRVVNRTRLPWWARDDADWLALLAEPFEALRLSPYHLVALEGVRRGEPVRFVRERERAVLGRVERDAGGEVVVVEHPVGALAGRAEEEGRVHVRHGAFRGRASDAWAIGDAPGGGLVLDPPCRRPPGPRPPRRYRLSDREAAAALAAHVGAWVRADGLVLPGREDHVLDPDVVTRQDDAWDDLYDAGLDRGWGPVESDLDVPACAPARSVA